MYKKTLKRIKLIWKPKKIERDNSAQSDGLKIVTF